MSEQFNKADALDLKFHKAAGNVLLGWAVVSKRDGENLVDRQGDHIPEDALYNAVLKFSKGDQKVLRQHGGEPVGKVIYSMPLTSDVQKALGIQSNLTGWAVGVEASPAVLELFDKGDLTGFSIGGRLHEFS